MDGECERRVREGRVVFDRDRRVTTMSEEDRDDKASPNEDPVHTTPPWHEIMC